MLQFFIDLWNAFTGSSKKAPTLPTGEREWAKSELKTIKHGATGELVKHLQRLLARHGVFSGSIGGNFKGLTEAAVKAFQRAHGLVADGVVGPKTWDALVYNSILDVAPNEEQVWMNIAEEEIGVKEIAGSQHNPRILEYHATTSYKGTTDEVPWCASFVCWVLIKAGYKSTKSAAAISYDSYGTKLEVPKYGCIAVFKRTGGNHVGFYVGETPTHIKVLGGNQSNQVKVSLYAKSALRSYRWPVK